MTNAKAWFKEHAVEVIGVVVAAVVGFLLLIKAKGGGSSGVVAPASIQTPAVSGSGSSGGSSGVSASDVQAAITSALSGYVTTTQEQADIGGIFAAIESLGQSTADNLKAATDQLKQGESQDISVLTSNLTDLSKKFGDASTQWATVAGSLTGQQQQQANQIASLNQQVSQAAKAGDVAAVNAGLQKLADATAGLGNQLSAERGTGTSGRTGAGLLSGSQRFG